MCILYVSNIYTEFMYISTVCPQASRWLLKISRKHKLCKQNNLLACIRIILCILPYVQCTTNISDPEVSVIYFDTFL